MITAARRLKSMMTSAGVMSSQVVVMQRIGGSARAYISHGHICIQRRNSGPYRLALRTSGIAR